MARAARKKQRINKRLQEQAESGATALADKLDKIPKSLVMRRGKTAAEVVELVQDLRNLFLPYTALNFKEDARNRKLTLQQYASHLAMPMGISHMLAFTQNENRLSMRLARTPEGPTLHFRVHQFSLSGHIKRLQRRPIAHQAGCSSALTRYPPVVVTHQFGDATAPPHVKLMRITFQNMFPAINVTSVRLKQCRRVVLFHYFPADESKNRPHDIVQWRHYAIQAAPTGVHRRVRRIVQAKKIPNLSKLDDIADYLDASSALAGNQSDSEAEMDDPKNIVQLADDYVGRGNNSMQTSALKLVELGPRLSLELVKVEKGLGQGAILYHAHVKKSAAEVANLQTKHERAVQIKQQRKTVQEQNVERKRQAAEAAQEAKAERKRKREQETMKALRKGGALNDNDDGDEDEDSGNDSDEDVEE